MEGSKKSKLLWQGDPKILMMSLWGLIGVLIVMTIVLFLFQRAKTLSELEVLDSATDYVKREFEISGTVGDSINGILAPLIGSLAVLTTFLAFYVQFSANNQQKRDLEIERFENKFYNMLQIHRQNVTETGVGKSLNGRRTFISMFNELKYIYLSTINFYKTKKAEGSFPEMDKDKLYNIAYLIFFFGIGPNSTKIIHDLLGDKYDGFINSLEEYLKGCQTTWRKERDKGNPIGADDGNDVFNLDIKYLPCNGHMSKLSHYIRHLYQLVKYVHDAKPEIFDYDAKYNYIATVRSQLSTHEQLLLFYNAVSALGKPWQEDPNLLEEYCVIKSAPLPLADFYITPEEKLNEVNEHGKKMFEWNEIKERLKNA